MSLGATRTARMTLWTVAGLAWSWAAVATVARGEAVEASAAPSPTGTAVAVAEPGLSEALADTTPGRVLVLRLSQPPEPEVIVRRVYVEVPSAARAAGPATTGGATSSTSAPTVNAPAPPPAPAAPAPPPPPQRSTGS